MERSVLTIGSRWLPTGVLLMVACSGSDGGGAGILANGGSSQAGANGSIPNAGSSNTAGSSGNASGNAATAGGIASGGQSRTGGSMSIAGGQLGTSGNASGGQLGSGGTTVNTTGSAGRTGGTNSGGRSARTGGANAGGTSNSTSGANAGGASAGTGGANAGGTTGVGGVATGGASGAGGSTSLNCPAPPTSAAYAIDSTGVTFTIGTGRLRVQVCKEDIIRVQYTSTSTIPTKTSLSVSATWGTVPFCVSESSGTVTIATVRMKAKVVTSTGLVSYTDLSDGVILAESSKSTTATTVEGTSTYSIKTAFNSLTNEALYGLGQHQDNNMNLKGKSVQLLNANTQINIPVLVSNKGYGIFWDNYSTSNFSSTGSTTSYSSECGEGVDYYFFYGPSIDHVIALYRATTGTAPLFPKWAYGLFQSKDHYSTQAEVLNVANGYRNVTVQPPVS